MSAENTESAPVGGSLADRVTKPDDTKPTGTNETTPSPSLIPPAHDRRYLD
jgi:hypothetical protein